MKIKIATSESNTDKAASEFAALLKESFKGMSDITVTDDSDFDIFHAIGAIDQSLAKKITNTHRHLIPIVSSPLATISPWQTTSKTSCLKHSPFLHAIGAAESQYLKHKYPHATIIMIKNPTVTSEISSSQMAHGFYQLYQQAIHTHDENMRADIKKKVDSICNDVKDENINILLNKFLYIRYKYLRHQIRKHELEELATVMIQTDYDEDLMSNILEQMKIYNFVASLEEVLSQFTSLTEGFMPIPQGHNSLTKKIISYII